MGPSGDHSRLITLVAVPAKDDPVWDISSEKVPHLTMLVFDENVEDLVTVLEYIRHVTATSLRPFSLVVNRRGVLGDKDADVLFFGNYGLDRVANARSHILQQPDVNRAWHAVEQYPEWIPHLTLGYPETPATFKKSNEPVPYSVHFDRLELWTGDYEGTEFPLMPHDDVMLQTDASLEEVIEHFGVKGMKWGIRRDEPSRQTNSGYSQDAAVARRTQAKIQKQGGLHGVSNKELAALNTRLNLEQNYKRMVVAEPTKLEKAKKYVSTAQKVGTAINTVITFVNSPAGKLIRKTVLKI